MKNNRVKVEIITIGDEILIGQIVDTNSAWMAVELNKAGFEIAQITSIHDDEAQIIESLQSALDRADVVLFTGGIGPTKDDITKQTLCKFFGTKLVFDESVYKNIEQLFAHRNNVMNELTKAQAMVPESATVIQNKVGTAPITWFEKGGKIAVSMPGVPYEMKEAMSTDILPRLQEHFDTPVILHKTLLVYGYPESALAIKIADWEDALPENIHLAYLPNYGVIRLRLSGTSDNISMLSSQIDEEVQKVKKILGEAIISEEDVSIEQWLADLLLEKGKTIATAESCTGGNIAHMITAVSGSSRYFKGSVVAYSNEIKENVLQVSAPDIAEQGAVSQTVVEQMADGVRKLMNTDIAIATSGIMGPDGGTDDKPVGTVWIAVSSAEKIISRKYSFGYKREQNIERTSQAALLMVKEVLI